jgi:hypothetical protein
VEINRMLEQNDIVKAEALALDLLKNY